MTCKYYARLQATYITEITHNDRKSCRLTRNKSLVSATKIILCHTWTFGAIYLIPVLHKHIYYLCKARPLLVMLLLTYKPRQSTRNSSDTPCPQCGSALPSHSFWSAERYAAFASSSFFLGCRVSLATSFDFLTGRVSRPRLGHNTPPHLRSGSTSCFSPLSTLSGLSFFYIHICSPSSA